MYIYILFYLILYSVINIYYTQILCIKHLIYASEPGRTAGGKKNGSLSGYHPAELGAAVCDALLERQKLKGSEVQDVVFGCVSQVGAQAPPT